MDNPNSRMRPLSLPPMNVQMDATAEQLSAMIARVEAAFSDVQYDAPFRGQLDEKFLRGGKEQVELLLSTFARCQVDWTALKTCFELGCGHGRATVALAELFPKVIAADVSGPHLHAANENARTLGRENIAFVHANKISSLGVVPRFDAFFSRFVLQHDPPPIQKHILEMILPKLNHGGYGYFQIATYALGYEFDPETYLASPLNLRVPEMHMFPQRNLFRLLEQHECQVVEVREDESAGPVAISFHMLVMKR